MTSVRVGFGVDDLSRRSVGAFLKALQPILTAPAGTSWRLDLDSGDNGYLGPTAAAVVASSILLAKRRQHEAAVSLPQAPPRLAAFCEFSGLAFLSRTGKLASPPEADPAGSETAPLQQFHRMNWGGSTPLVRLVRRHLSGLAADSEDLLRTCYSEIVQNIEDHAQSPIGGVICARYFEGRREIRVAVADRGVGIGEHLRGALSAPGCAIRDDVHALELVLRGNVTSKSRPNNMGQGISNLATIARGNDGKLIIFSGQAHAEVDSQTTRAWHAPDRSFPGTLILLSLRVFEGDSEPDVD